MVSFGRWFSKKVTSFCYPAHGYNSAGKSILQRCCDPFYRNCGELKQPTSKCLVFCSLSWVGIFRQCFYMIPSLGYNLDGGFPKSSEVSAIPPMATIQQARVYCRVVVIHFTEIVVNWINPPLSVKSFFSFEGWVLNDPTLTARRGLCDWLSCHSRECCFSLPDIDVLRTDPLGMLLYFQCQHPPHIVRMYPSIQGTPKYRMPLKRKIHSEPSVVWCQQECPLKKLSVKQ